jgi:hypothetical protein
MSLSKEKSIEEAEANNMPDQDRTEQPLAASNEASSFCAINLVPPSTCALLAGPKESYSRAMLVVSLLDPAV